MRTGILISVGLFAAVAFTGAGAREPKQPVTAYVSNEKDGTVTVIKTSSDDVIATFSIGGRLRGIHLSPDGRQLYVAMSYPSNQRLEEFDKKQ